MPADVVARLPLVGPPDLVAYRDAREVSIWARAPVVGAPDVVAYRSGPTVDALPDEPDLPALVATSVVTLDPCVTVATASISSPSTTGAGAGSGSGGSSSLAWQHLLLLPRKAKKKAKKKKKTDYLDAIPLPRLGDVPTELPPRVASSVVVLERISSRASASVRLDGRSALRLDGMVCRASATSIETDVSRAVRVLRTDRDELRAALDETVWVELAPNEEIYFDA